MTSKNGTICIVPDFDHFMVKLIIVDDGAKISADIPILKDVPEREYYARSATEITEETNIKFDKEQPLMALIYDNDHDLNVPNISDIMDTQADYLRGYDFLYYFTFEFEK